MPPKTTWGPRGTSDLVEYIIHYLMKKAYILAREKPPQKSEETVIAWKQLAIVLNQLNPFLKNF